MPVSHIENLDHEQRRYALQMFAKLAENQQGYPEQMGGAISREFNPSLNHSQGVYTYLTEHVGDITHRMAQPHCEDYAFFHDLVVRKVGMSLRELRSASFSSAIESQLKAEYDFRKSNKQTVPKWDEWVEAWKAAGRKYAEAHGALTVWNRAQFSAREAAVALGLHDWQGARNELEVLESLLKTTETWEKYAGEVWLNDKGVVTPVSKKSKNPAL